MATGSRVLALFGQFSQVVFMIQLDPLRTRSFSMTTERPSISYYQSISKPEL